MARPSARNKVRQLFIDERGTSGDLTEVWIRCECGKAERSMAQAAILANRALGLCDGSEAVAWPVHQRVLRGTEQTADPLCIQRILPTDDERDITPRQRRRSSASD